jgi:hypothetical protein
MIWLSAQLSVLPVIILADQCVSINREAVLFSDHGIVDSHMNIWPHHIMQVLCSSLWRLYDLCRFNALYRDIRRGHLTIR